MEYTDSGVYIQWSIQMVEYADGGVCGVYLWRSKQVVYTDQTVEYILTGFVCIVSLWYSDGQPKITYHDIDQTVSKHT